MSTTTDESSKLYFCYQCNALVTIPTSSSPDLICPTCHGGFLEEHDDQTQTQSHTNPNPLPPDLPPFFSSSSDSSSSTPFNSGFRFMFDNEQRDLDRNRLRFNEQLNPADLTAALFGLAGGSGGRGERSGYVGEPEVYNPMMFLQNYLNTLRPGGANIQFVIENSGTGGGGGEFRLPTNLGDYFVGPGLERLIQQLAENDPNRYGTPPASKEAVEKLPDVKISEELLVSDDAQCAVCMDTFEMDSKAKQMPCKHIYHNECILPWLELHNSCPVCRYELPTDDPDYEQGVGGGRRDGVNASAAGDEGSVNLAASIGTSGESSGEGSGGAERGSRIQLPWPFNALGFGADGSNSGGGNPNNEDSGGRSHQ